MSEGISSTKGVPPFITQSQVKVFLSLESRLQRVISSRFARSGKGRKETRSLLQIFDKLSKELYPSYTHFFVTLLLGGERDFDKTVARISGLDDQRLFSLFFQCASTRRSEYYSASELVEMTECFFEARGGIAALKEDQFLPYDQGGKERLVELTKAFGFRSTFSKSQLCPRVNNFQRQCKLLEGRHSETDRYDRLFEKLELDADYALLSEANRCRVAWIIGAAISSGPDEDLEESAELASVVLRDKGGECLEKFCRGIRSPVQLSLITQIFRVLVKSQNDELLDRFSSGDLTIEQFAASLSSSQEEILLEAPPRNIEDLLRRFGGDDPNVAFPLSKEDLLQLEIDFSQVEHHRRQWSTCSLRQLKRLASEICRGSIPPVLDREKSLQLIAIGKLAFKVQRGIDLHDTQVMTVLGLLLPRYSGKCIAQVKTGEGKSFIVALQAFVLAMQGQRVHVVSSDQRLAIRDWRQIASFFDSFDLSSGHIAMHFPAKERFLPQILYGTVTDFEFALMRELLDDAELFVGQRGDRRFDAVIVDEADNLAIDTLLNSARLSLPAEETYGWVYEPIFQYVKENRKSRSASGVRSYLEGYRGGRFALAATKLSDVQLEMWLGSAHRAQVEFEEGRDYIARTRTGEDGQKRREIVIVDAKNTGRLKESSRWSYGIHEFVEVKHGIDPKEESLNPISMSHAVFYQHYRRVFGLTGTLGSAIERQELKSIYGLDSFDVPTHKPPRRKDYPSRLVLPEKQMSRILKRINECQQKGRPILVLCQSIRETVEIAKFLEGKLDFKVLNEIQEESEEDILAVAGLPGAVTIATNTAGRGTDIKLDVQSMKNGGLHVLINFWPQSDRVEGQARGRAGRQGERGSSEIFVTAEGGETLESFVDKRAKQVKALAGEHLVRAERDRVYYRYSQSFFELLNRFRRACSTDLVNGIASQLGSRQLSKETGSKLNQQDGEFASRAWELLRDRRDTTRDWKPLLLEIANRIGDKVLSEWALKIHQPMENQQEGQKALVEVFMERWSLHLDPSGKGIIEYIREITGAALPHVAV